MKTPEKVAQEQKSLLNVNDFFKKIIIVGDNIKKSRYENGIIIMQSDRVGCKLSSSSDNSFSAPF